MNLLCPNCQKMLTVPEQYAGQLMKCPLCSGTFTVPALPQTSAVPAGAPTDLLPSSSPPPSSPPPPSAVQPGAELYSVRVEPEPTPPPAAPPVSPPPEPAAADLHPPFTLPEEKRATTPSTAPPEGYQHTATAWFSPRVLQWVPPVAVFLIFLLQFFPWVGVYPGGVPAVWQNAWQAMYGGHSEDNDTLAARDFQFHEAEQKPGGETVPDNRPGFSTLTFFYLVLFLPTLFITIGIMVLPFVHINLPPQVEQLMPWRWGIVALANLLTFLFLFLQLLVGFSLESRVENAYDAQAGLNRKQTATTPELRKAEVERGKYLDMLHRTWWLKLAVLLHLLAILCAALMLWLGQRHEGEPLPRIQLQW